MLAAIVVLTAAAYLPLFSNAFVWRDREMVIANPALRSTRALAWTWTHPLSKPPYRPVAMTFLWPQYQLWRNWNPAGYHFVSLALHLVNTVLLWLLLRRLGVGAASVAVGLFAVHPTAVQSVTCIAEQPILLATLLSLASLLVLLRPTRGDLLARPAWIHLSVSSVLYVAALLADAHTAAGMPVALLLVLWWKQEVRSRQIQKWIKTAIVLAAVMCATYVWNQPTSDLPLTTPLWKWIASLPLMLVIHLRNLLIPFPLVIATEVRSTLWQWLGVAGLAVSAVALWRLRGRVRRGAKAAGAIFLAMLIPAMVLDEGRSVVDSQQYFARASLLVLCAVVAERVIPDADDRTLFRASRRAVAIMTSLVLAVMTWRYAANYHDDLTAWRYALYRDPVSRLAHRELGEAMLANDQTSGAIAEFQALLVLAPNDIASRLLLSDALAQQDSAESLVQLQRAAELRANDPAIVRRLAAAANRRNDIPAAIELYQKTLAIDPRDAVAHNNLATILARQGLAEQAVAHYTRAIEIDPQSTDARINVARLFIAMGKLDEAADHLRRAVSMDPNNFDAYLTSGDVLMRLNDFHNAERMFRAALRVRRDSPAAFNALGVALAAQGQQAEAIYSFGRAIDLDASYEPAKQNLAAAKAQSAARPR